MNVASLNPKDFPVLKVKGLGKEYRLYDSPRDRFKSLLFNSQHYKSHWALRNVSFELRPGQCLGVIGDNGAGKSSLLKLMAGTLQPTVGSVERLGRVTAILELGAGFHPDFSGRNNLRFAGSLIGISPSEMNSLEAEIIAFAELEEAIDRPIKTYSSGMIVRLAFSLVTAVIPNLLIVDEALAVGDQYFQKKCTERIEEFRRSGCTILFCSHSLYHVRQLCDMALWLHKGEVKAYGETEMVLASYETHVRGQGEDRVEKVPPITSDISSKKLEEEIPVQPIFGQVNTGIVRVEIEILNDDNPPVLQSSDLIITVTAAVKIDECPNIGIMLERVDGVGVTSVASHAEQAQPIKSDSGQWIMKLTFDDIPLQTGEYMVSAYLFDSRGLVVYDEWHRYKSFKIIKSSLTPGLVRLPHHWN